MKKWKLVRQDLGLLKSSKISIMDENGAWVCIVQNNGIIGPKEGNLNAKIIELAPEMFSACKQALSFVCVEEPIYDVLTKIINTIENG